MSMETLKCEYDKKPHNWKRESTRGRKPRFCPKHKPAPVVRSNSTVTTQPNGFVLLHCEIGDHTWERESKRGRKPTNCPEHAPVIAPIVPAERNSNGLVTLHCEAGDHDWEREPKKGRKPASCPTHTVGPRAVPVAVINGTETGDPAPKKRGRPKLYANEEEQAAAELARSIAKVDSLEEGLKARGTHISQQTPYILYKKTAEKASRVKGRAPTTEWEMVASHSPLMREQFLKEHEAEFLAKTLRYERENAVVS